MSNANGNLIGNARKPGRLDWVGVRSKSGGRNGCSAAAAAAQRSMDTSGENSKNESSHGSKLKVRKASPLRFL